MTARFRLRMRRRRFPDHSIIGRDARAKRFPTAEQSPASSSIRRAFLFRLAATELRETGMTSGSRHSAIFRDALWLPLLLLVFMAQWGQVLFSEQTFYFRDLFFFYTPLLVEAGRQLLSGVFPAWNPNLGGGTPLAADPNLGLFFPDMLLLPLLNGGAQGVEALLLFRLLALALAAYVALRAASLSPPSAFLGAALVSLSGPVSSSLSSFPHHLAGALLLLPLAVCGFHLASPGKHAALVAPVLVALLLFAGSPEMAVQGGLLFVLCGARQPLRRTATRIVASLSVGLLLAAPQILPALRLFPRTPRGHGWALATPPGFLSFPPQRLVEFVFPGFFGDPSNEFLHAFWGRGFSSGVKPYLMSVAVGLAALVLLPFAWTVSFGRRLAVGAAAFLLLSFGKYLPFGERLLELPILRIFRFPEKWMIGAVIVLAALGAVGFEGLRRNGIRATGASGVAAVLALLSAGLIAMTLAAPGRLLGFLRETRLLEPGFPTALEAFVLRTTLREGTWALLVSLTLLSILLVVRRVRSGSFLPLLLILVGLVERVPRAVGATPTIPIDVFSVPAEGTRRALEEAAEGRFFYDREATTSLDQLRPFTGTVFGLSYAGNTDVDHFSDVRSRAFAETLQRLDFSDSRKLALLRLSNVKVLSTNDPFARSSTGMRWLRSLPDGRDLYAVEGSRPARLFFHAVSAPDEIQALRYTLARGLPVESVAVAEGTAPIRAPSGEEASVRVSFPRPDSIRAQVSSDRDAILQIASTFDPNWRIFMDGRRVEPLVIDSVFLGVRVPTGRHDLRAEFRDWSFAAGVTISALSLACLGLYARAGRRRATPEVSRKP